MSNELSHLERPHGSSEWSQGTTRVLAAVYSNMDVKASKMLPDRATVEVIFKPKTGLPGIAERQIEESVRGIVEACVLTSLHPRTGLTIVLQEMHDDGALFSCAVNATAMALVDAGVPMASVFASITCALKPSGEFVLDPTLKEIATASAIIEHTFTNTSNDTHIVASHVRGIVDEQTLPTVLGVQRKCTSKIFAFYRLSWQRRLGKLQSKPSKKTA